MTARRSPNERLAVLEQKVSHMEAELARMSAKVDEMHTILLQARGVRWAIIAVAGLVGFLAGISHWVMRGCEAGESYERTTGRRSHSFGWGGIFANSR